MTTVSAMVNQLVDDNGDFKVIVQDMREKQLYKGNASEIPEDLRDMTVGIMSSQKRTNILILKVC